MNRCRNHPVVFASEAGFAEEARTHAEVMSLTGRNQAGEYIDEPTSK